MLIDPNDIERLCEILHRAGQKIVFTNGCFDILHAGHVRYLEKARSFGDCLVLGLNTDASMRGNKGPARPINGELDRAEVVGALKAVDYVVLFGEKTAETIMAKIVQSYGGRVEFVQMVAGRSTTNVIKKIEQLQEQEGEV